MTREVINELKKYTIGKKNTEKTEISVLNINRLIFALEEQEPKTGHWITQWNPVHQKEYYYCSECREEYSYDGETGIKMNNYKYCPNCGAKMVESEDKK